MALVDLGQAGEELGAPGPRRRVGWQEQGELVASATLSRPADDTVEIHELARLTPSATAADRRRDLLNELADSVNAATLTAEVGADEISAYEDCGFAVDPEASASDGRSRCSRRLDAA